LALRYEEAVKTILKHTRVLEAEEQAVVECTGQVTAEDVCAHLSLPQSDISGPDGYAVRSADIKGAGKDNPVTLRIIETVRAGYLPVNTLKQGTAIRIMTGSVVPVGADCVVRFEDTDEPANENGPNKNNPSLVKIYVSAKPGTSIRPAGSNIRKGLLIVPKGTVIGPTQISALVSAGKERIRVIRRPVIAIIATGDELVNSGEPLAPGKTYSCNTAAMASLVAHYGGRPRILGIARDRETDLVGKIRKGMNADAILTSGGVSKGDYDLVRLVLGQIGELVFTRIKMAPGAAVAFGLVNRRSADGADASIPIFCLAGPPAGCFINFETLARPALLKMRGFSPAAISHPTIDAIAADSVSQRMAMAFVRWTHLEKVGGEYRVTLNLGEKAGMLASMARANSLTIIPEGSVVKRGDRIQVLPFDWFRAGIHA
jgi:molybdopterin molybdotransferase